MAPLHAVLRAWRRAQRRCSGKRSARFSAASPPRGRTGRAVTRHQDVHWTYADLLRRSEDFAVGLKELGLEKGDRIGIWSPNGSEWVLAQFGTALAGLILVNINPAYRVPRIRLRHQEIWLPGADPEPRPQEQRLFRFAPSERARDRRGRAGQLRSRACPSSNSSSAWAREDDRHARFRRGREAGDASRARSSGLRRKFSSTTRSTSSSPPARPARPRARR